MNERQIAYVKILSKEERAAYKAYHGALPGDIARRLTLWRYALESLAYYVSVIVR